MKIISSKASKELANKIAEMLGCDFVEVHIDRFCNGEFDIKVPSITREELIIVSNYYSNVHETLIEIFFLIDAIRQYNANKITLVFPYIPYSREDRKHDEEFSSFRTIFNIFKILGVHKVITLDMHSDRLKSLSEGIDLIELTSLDIIRRYIKNNTSIDILVSADAGRADFIRNLSKEFGLPYVSLSKVRNKDATCKSSIIQGSVKGKTALIVDDIIDTGNTLKEAIRVLLNSGAENVDAFVTHGFITKKSMNLIHSSGIRSLTITDSVNNMNCGSSFIDVISIAETISVSIKKQVCYEARIFG